MCSLLVAAVAVTGARLASGQIAGGVIEARGAATYRIPIVVPPGAAGHGPVLALVYDSGRGRGAAGWIGFGWSLAGAGRIERSTARGTPYDYERPACTGVGAPPCYRDDFVLDGEPLVCASADCGSAGVYRLRRDDGRQVERLGPGAGWKVRDRAGRVLFYGAEPSGRTPNPRTGEVFSWRLERSQDAHGNWIEYAYDTASSEGTAYLREVRWAQSGALANRRVVFELNAVGEPRPDPVVRYRAGFRQVEDRRLAAIAVYAAGDAPVTRYALTYTEEAHNRRSLLAGVQRLGSDGFTSLPPHRFVYTASVNGFDPVPDPVRAARSDGPSLTAPLAHTITGRTTSALLDMNRDALADAVFAPGFPASGVWVNPNLGSHFDPNDYVWNEGNVSALVESDSVYDYARTLDVDGDGYPDSVTLAGVALGGERGVQATAPLYNASGWPVSYVPGSGGQVAEPELAVRVGVAQHTAFIDVTGDGLPDRVLSVSGGVASVGPTGYVYAGPSPGGWSGWSGWVVYPNLGLRGGSIEFAREPLRWPVPSGGPFLVRGLVHTFGAVPVDWNGDGLVDRVFDDAVELNFGAGFEPARERPFVLAEIREIAGCRARGYVDLNGDGFIDLVDAGVNTPFRPAWQVFWGGSDGLGPVPSDFAVESAPGNGCLESGSQYAAPAAALADLDGDGLLDRVGPNVNQLVRRHLGGTPGLLLRATGPLGGSLEFEYAHAAQQSDASGRPASPGFSDPRPLVVRLTTRDGREGTPEIATAYHYARGVSDPATREIRAFGQVTRSEIEEGLPGTQTRLVHATDLVCAGRLEQREVSRAGAVLRREQRTYQRVRVEGPSGDWTRCLLAERVAEAVEGDVASARTQHTFWDYGPDPAASHFNVQRVLELGELGVAGDERITHLAYATPLDPASARLSALSEIRVEDAAPVPVVVLHERVHYDGLAHGALDAGLPTRVERRLESPLEPGSQWVSVRATAYDARGLPVARFGPPTRDDPDGFLATRSYDAEYASFVRERVAGADSATPLVASTQTASGCAPGLPPPPGLGLECVATTPQGESTVFGYDPLGRILSVQHPGGLLETRSYAHAPETGESVLETRLEAAGEVLVERRFVDGLGRGFREEWTGAGGETVRIERSFDSRGRLASETWPFTDAAAPLERALDYDALGRPAVITDYDGFTHRSFRYAPWSVTDEVYFGSAEDALRQTRSVRTLDGLGRLVRVSSWEDAGDPASAPLVVEAEYDAADRLVRARDPIDTAPELCVERALGPLCAEQRHVTRVYWDTLGRRVGIDDPDSGSWRFSYDAAGLLLRRVDAVGAVLGFEYDALKRTTRRTTLPGGLGSSDATFSYGEDSGDPPAYGRLGEVRAEGASYRYAYDSAGRLERVVQTTAGLEFQSVWRRDALGRVTSRTFPDGETFAYVHDGDRLAAVRGDPNNVFAGEVFGAARYDSAGRLESLAVAADAGGSPALTLEYAYAADTARLETLRATPGILRADDLDADGVPDGLDVCPHVFDPEQQASSQAPDLGCACLCGDLDRDCRVGIADAVEAQRAGLVPPLAPLRPGTDTRFCDVTGDGACNVSDSIELQRFGLVPPLAPLRPEFALDECDGYLGRGITPDSGPLELELVLDGLGRPTQQSGSMLGDAVARSFEYDGLGRLARASGPWEKPLGYEGPVAWTYTYDPLGSPRAQTSSRGAGYERSWSHADPLRPRFATLFADSGGAELLVADAGGRVAERAGEAFLWNAQGRLHAIAGRPVTYAYDTFGVRVLARYSDTDVVRVGDDFLYDVASGHATKVFALGRTRIATLATRWAAPASGEPAPPAAPPDGGPGSHGLHREPLLAHVSDHLGSTRAVVNGDGVVVETRDYAPFGMTTSHQGSFSLRARFTGQPEDEVLGLYDYGARVYDPRWARFASPDELRESLDTQGLHAYAYARAQPTTRIDPDGRTSIYWSMYAPRWSSSIQQDLEYRSAVARDQLGSQNQDDRATAARLSAEAVAIRGELKRGVELRATLAFEPPTGPGGGGYAVGDVLMDVTSDEGPLTESQAEGIRIRTARVANGHALLVGLVLGGTLVRLGVPLPAAGYIGALADFGIGDRAAQGPQIRSGDVIRRTTRMIAVSTMDNDNGWELDNQTIVLRNGEPIHILGITTP